MTSKVTWRKSRYSGGTSNNCVLVRNDLTALSDTKDPHSVIDGDVVALVVAIRAGRLSG